MNKKYQLLLFFLLFSIKLFAQQRADIAASVKSEASRSGLSFLNLIPEGREKEYGFSGRRDFARIAIEEPYQTYYVVANGNKLMFVAGNEWRIPVSVDNKFVGLLTVQMNDGKPTVVDFGGNVLAQKIQEAEQLHPVGAGPRTIIRNTVLKNDYLVSSFAGICGAHNTSGLIEINTKSTQPIYQLNEATPVEVRLADFYAETMDMLAKQPR